MSWVEAVVVWSLPLWLVVEAVIVGFLGFGANAAFETLLAPEPYRALDDPPPSHSGPGTLVGAAGLTPKGDAS